MASTPVIGLNSSLSNASLGVYYTKQQVLEVLQNAHLDQDINLVFIMCSSIFIFLMQMGFAMVEAGTVRAKNSSNILLKNLLDTYVGAIVYYLVGYGLANDAKGGIVGNYHFASLGFTETDYLNWILQYSVCSNIPTIVAGSLAERTFVDTYMFFALLMTGMVYPIVAAWTWGGGWLSVLGFKDFAGAGVIHLLGGVCGMVGTIILGPRLGMYGNNQLNKLDQQEYNKSFKLQQKRDQLKLDHDIKGKLKQEGLAQIKEDESATTDAEAGVRNVKNEKFRDQQMKMVYLEMKHKLRRRSNSQTNITLPKQMLHQDLNTHSRSPIPKQYPKFHKRVHSPPVSNRSHFMGPTFHHVSNKLDNISQFSSSHIDRHYHKAIKVQRDREEQIKRAAAATDLQVLGPAQIARIEKIRKEFPEFSNVQDRLLNQIIQLYDINIKSPIKPSSVSLIAQGSFFLWICWLFYNSGASQGISFSKQNSHPGRIVMNTIVSSAASCVSILFFRPIILSKEDPTNKYPLQAICNTLLVGLVSITGCGDNVLPWAAVLIGILGTMIYCLACKLYSKLKIDDPLEASQIHGFCGLWGVLAVGFFDKDLGLLVTGDFNLLLNQMIGAFSIILWGVVTSFLYFYCLKKVNKFRVGYIYEITGMDVLMHGGTDLLSNDMINKIEARQRSIANANRLGEEPKDAN